VFSTITKVKLYRAPTVNDEAGKLKSAVF